MIGRHSANARRLYLHTLYGGRIKPIDMERVVRAIEELEAEVERLKEAK